MDFHLPSNLDSWNFDYNKASKITILYGSDTALRYSLWNEIPAEIISEQMLNNQMLFHNERIKINFIKKVDLNKINYACFVTAETYINPSKLDIIYIKCEPLNISQKKKFIEFHSKRLDFQWSNLSDLKWVENLDDLIFANKLQILMNSPALKTENNKMQWNLKYSKTVALTTLNPQEIWQWLYYKSTYSTRNILYKQIMLWAKTKSPGNETIIWVVQKILNEYEMNNA